jgi:hypothetical protein
MDLDQYDQELLGTIITITTTILILPIPLPRAYQSPCLRHHQML